MIVLRDPQQLNQVTQSDIKIFLQQRFHDICEPEPYDPDEHGFFILVQPGDTAEQVELETGYSLIKSMFNNTVYGDSDFSPDFEYMEDHGGFYEAVFIFTDSGFAGVLIVPKDKAIDSKILEICTEFATTGATNMTENTTTKNQANTNHLFNPGQVVSTPGALEAMSDNNCLSLDLLTKHLAGDWGNVPKEDAEANQQALKTGARIISSYTLENGARIWIITEADRSSTTFLLPEEY
ncbi:MAG: hypothetical protein PSV18_01830 [Methylobacter sp.]|nr:hypothetical protein [Candidatus Methylobacter titanis]